ncbi:hypothetical protein [Streptomyces sp. NPDC047061]|uniref:hypothetical protein n=1 Tax=Streptomyces sp. NPDC047061 TaxID=3154605 RepID=UPI0033E732D1
MASVPNVCGRKACDRCVEALLESLDASGQEWATEQLREILSFVAASTGDVAITTGKAAAR